MFKNNFFREEQSNQTQGPKMLSRQLAIIVHLKGLCIAWITFLVPGFDSLESRV